MPEASRTSSYRNSSLLRAGGFPIPRLDARQESRAADRERQPLRVSAYSSSTTTPSAETQLASGDTARTTSTR